MSPTRRQLLAGMFGASAAAVLPDSIAAAPDPVEPMKGVMALIQGRTESNRVITMSADGTVAISHVCDDDHRFVFSPNERYTPAEWVENMMSVMLEMPKYQRSKE